MYKRFLVPILVVWTLGIGLYKLSTGYGPEGQVFLQVVRSFSYAAAPWLFALIWAAIVTLGARPFKKQVKFRSSYLRAVLVFLIVLTLVQIVQLASAQSQQGSLTPRDAALRVMGASVATPGIAAYCIKTYGIPANVFSSVEGWNRKHEPLMRKAIQVIEATGGMSADERKALDQVGFKLAQSAFDGDDNPASTCKEFAGSIAQGAMDMSRQEELQEALRIVEKFTP